MNYCEWDFDDLNKNYHDNEWGVPLFDDDKQFEFLCLEVFQCGLSWNTILHKREILKKCFADFKPKVVANFNENDVGRIMKTPNMIKSSKKIEACIINAQKFLSIQQKYQSFSKFLWDYCGGKTILYENHDLGEIPSSNALSLSLSKELKKFGFKFLGPVVVYSHLQACGIINDHFKNCPSYHKIIKNYPCQKLPRLGEK